MTGFKPLSKHFSRQKCSAHFGKKREKGVIVRNSVFGLTVSKASGRQYCMQSIPLAVLKRSNINSSNIFLILHAIHTACGIETASIHSVRTNSSYCMQSIPLAVLKHKMYVTFVQKSIKLHAIHTACGIETKRTKTCRTNQRYCMQSIPLAVLKPCQIGFTPTYISIACNPYRLRY